MKCKYCGSDDLVRAKVKKTSILIAVCRECDSVYELDEISNPIMEYASEDVSHILELQKCFKKWDELTEIVPYNKS